MKAQKLLSLDIEIIQKLQLEANASKIVNDLLNDYYRTAGTKTKQELIEALECLNKDKLETNQQMKTLKAELEAIKEKEIERQTKGPRCPNCMEDRPLILSYGQLTCTKCGYAEPNKDL